MRCTDLAKLTLIGRLGKNPEVRLTKNEKEYVAFVLFCDATNVVIADEPM